MVIAKLGMDRLPVAISRLRLPVECRASVGIRRRLLVICLLYMSVLRRRVACRMFAGRVLGGQKLLHVSHTNYIQPRTVRMILADPRRRPAGDIRQYAGLRRLFDGRRRFSSDHFTGPIFRWQPT